MAENSPASTIGSLEPFDPETDDWPAYIKRLEQFFSVNNIANEKKVATVVTVIDIRRLMTFYKLCLHQRSL